MSGTGGAEQTEFCKNVIDQLCRQPRMAGTSASIEAQRFLHEKFESLGYSVRYEKAPFLGWKIIKAPEVFLLEPTYERWDALPMVGSQSTPEQGVAGTLDRAKRILVFEAFPWDRYSVMDDSGRVVAYLVSSQYPVSVQPIDDFAITQPHIIVSNAAREKIEFYLHQNVSTKVRLSIQTQILPESTLCNLIMASNRSEEDIIVCAHYDSMFNTVGAQDNASGVATLVLLARELSKDRSSLLPTFIAFDGEELNKIGSYAYVAKLREQDKLGKIKLVIELDAVSWGDRISLMTDCQLAKRLNVLFTNRPDISEMKVEVSGRDRIPFSDVWPFMRNKIPVVRVLSRGEEPYPYTHDPADTPDKIDSNMIPEVVKIIKAILEDFKYH